MQPMKLNWDDIRFFLAVVEHGSTKRAAAALKVDQTTCTRRIAALETALGLELFNRDQGRYRPAADALELLDKARTMQAAAEALSDLAEGKRRSRASKLRVTGEEAMATAFIFRDSYGRANCPQYWPPQLCKSRAHTRGP